MPPLCALPGALRAPTAGRIRRSGRALALRGALCLTLALAACVSQSGALHTSPTPPPKPQIVPDPETVTAATHYRAIEDYYRASGRLRTDSGRRDAPFTARQLADNFMAIALRDEFSEVGGRLVASDVEDRLHRWDGPIRLSLRFSPNVPPKEQAADRTYVAGYLARLARYSGLRITLTDRAPNYIVAVVPPADRRALGPSILALDPTTSLAAIRSVTDMAPDVYCTVLANTHDPVPVYVNAFAVVRSELPDIMRRACYDEEIAQSLGLTNDSPSARPSIFNDDQEFAALTPMDGLMLKMLYDPRLRPGMLPAEARPVVDQIAAELMGEAPSG